MGVLIEMIQLLQEYFHIYFLKLIHFYHLKNVNFMLERPKNELHEYLYGRKFEYKMCLL